MVWDFIFRIFFTQAGHFAALSFPAFAPYIFAGHHLMPIMTQVKVIRWKFVATFFTLHRRITRLGSTKSRWFDVNNALQWWPCNWWYWPTRKWHIPQWLTGKIPSPPSFSNPNYTEESGQKKKGEEEEEEEGGSMEQAIVPPTELPLIDNIWSWIGSKVLVLSNKG